MVEEFVRQDHRVAIRPIEDLNDARGGMVQAARAHVAGAALAEPDGQPVLDRRISRQHPVNEGLALRGQLSSRDSALQRPHEVLGLRDRPAFAVRRRARDAVDLDRRGELRRRLLQRPARSGRLS